LTASPQALSRTDAQIEAMSADTTGTLPALFDVATARQVLAKSGFDAVAVQLVGPDGTSVLLMSDVVSSAPVSGINLT
jgi:hypothetical protein